MCEGLYTGTGEGQYRLRYSMHVCVRACTQAHVGGQCARSQVRRQRTGTVEAQLFSLPDPQVLLHSLLVTHRTCLQCATRVATA